MSRRLKRMERRSRDPGLQVTAYLSVTKQALAFQRGNNPRNLQICRSFELAQNRALETEAVPCLGPVRELQDQRLPICHLDPQRAFEFRG